MSTNVRPSSRRSVRRWDIADQGDTALTEFEDGQYVLASDYDRLYFDYRVAVDDLRGRVLELEEQLRTQINSACTKACVLSIDHDALLQRCQTLTSVVRGEIGIILEDGYELNVAALRHELEQALAHEGAKDLRIAELERDLEHFGRHSDSCGDMDAYNHATEHLCNCGFDSALRAGDKS